MKRILTVALVFCWFPFFAQQTYTISGISPKLLKHSNSVVLDEFIDLDVTNHKTLKITTKRVVAVLNKMGDKDVSLYEHYSENSKIKKIEAIVYNASGKLIRRFKKKDFGDVSSTGGSMYADSRVMFVNYTPTSYPYIISFESQIESGDSAIINSWNPLGGYAESTARSVMTIKYDQQNKPRIKTENLDGYDISITETPSEIIFSADNLEAIRYEEHSPSSSKILPIVRIALENFHLKGVAGASKDWKDFGIWMENELLTDMRDLSASTVARMQILVANETSNEAKARKIYQYVQDKVRYVSIQIGIGGWKPMPASQVDQLGYGDCKALTNYTKALLDAVGVPSYYTIVYGDRGKRDIIDDFASIQGNHVILGIPDGDKITWLECTSQETPYGFIANFTDDRKVLILTPEGGEIVRTKTYETEENSQINYGKVILESNGNVTADLQSISQGIQYGNKYLLPRKKREEIDLHYKQIWSHINGFSISDLKFEDDREAIRFTQNLSLKIPRYANMVGNDLLFSPNIFNQNSYVPPNIANRLQKLNLPQGYLDKDSIEVEFPKSFILAAMPEPRLLETKFGTYEISFTKIDDYKVLFTRNLRMEKGEYEPSEYENYRDFLREIVILDKTKILFTQKSNTQSDVKSESLITSEDSK